MKDISISYDISLQAYSRLRSKVNERLGLSVGAYHGFAQVVECLLDTSGLESVEETTKESEKTRTFKLNFDDGRKAKLSAYDVLSGDNIRSTSVEYRIKLTGPKDLVRDVSKILS